MRTHLAEFIVFALAMALIAVPLFLFPDWWEDEMGGPTKGKFVLRKTEGAVPLEPAAFDAGWYKKQRALHADAVWNAAIEAAAWACRDQILKAEKNYEYFADGDGWRTHCAGAVGAEKAAAYFKERASCFQAAYDIIRALKRSGQPLDALPEPSQ